jgi:hypothetical protein
MMLMRNIVNVLPDITVCELMTISHRHLQRGEQHQ